MPVRLAAIFFSPRRPRRCSIPLVLDVDVRIGCAGWSLPRVEQGHFPEAGSHLARYASRFNAVEINSSFYRSHRPATYARWKESVPPSFRFSVKVPKAITHGLRLREAGEPMEAFLREVDGVADKLGCLLVQLPPSLGFEADVAGRFFADLRSRSPRPVACEPRHPSWFAPEVDALLSEHQVARVAADPSRVPEAADPGGWRGLTYYRLHGSPRMYYSSYEEEYIAGLAARIQAEAAAGHTVWCIFDNTTLGAATRNALDLRSQLG